MRMNIIKQLKGGKIYSFILYLCAALIFIYIADNIASYFRLLHYKGILSLLPDKPLLLFALMCSFALAMLIGIIKLDKEPNLCWILINIGAICALPQSFYSLKYHICDTDSIFLLQLISICLIIVTNRKSFISNYCIKRSFIKIMIIISTSVVFGLLSYIGRPY